MSNYKVFVGYRTPGFSKNDMFYTYLSAMKKPDGTMESGARGQSPARNLNILIKQAIANEYTHILCLDDDLAFPPDMLMKLLAHDLDIVSGFYCMRSFPHKPIVFKKTDELGRLTEHFYPTDDKLHEVAAVGLGCVLIKLDVFKSLEYPYIRLGEIEGDKDHWCDDVGFYKRVREAGYKIFCDFSIQVGHMASCTIFPSYKDGKWFIAIDTNGTQAISIPMGLE